LTTFSLLVALGLQVVQGVAQLVPVDAGEHVAGA
jgi:hypothetical protein